VWAKNIRARERKNEIENSARFHFPFSIFNGEGGEGGGLQRGNIKARRGTRQGTIVQTVYTTQDGCKISVEKKWSQAGVQKKYGRVYVANEILL
jgi:hypothetical protein